MPDAEMTLDGRSLERVAQVHELTDAAQHSETIAFDDRDTGRVVSAVLEPSKARDEYITRLTRTDVSDDSTHK
jgi:hypothetical protein